MALPGAMSDSSGLSACAFTEDRRDYISIHMLRTCARFTQNVVRVLPLADYNVQALPPLSFLLFRLPPARSNQRAVKTKVAAL